MVIWVIKQFRFLQNLGNYSYYQTTWYHNPEGNNISTQFLWLEDGTSRFLQNAGTCLLGYQATHSGRLYTVLIFTTVRT
jgi:hypothetical protein